MAFEAALDIPTKTTQSGYTLNRLGEFVTLDLEFSETIDDVAEAALTAVQDVDGDGVFETLVVPALAPLFDRLVGLPLALADGTPLGTAVAVDAAAKSVVVTGAPTPAMVGGVVRVRRINHFGIPVDRTADNGRTYRVKLTTQDPAQRERLLTILMTASFNLVSQTLTQAGIAFTPGQLVGALQALAAQGVNLDTFLVEEFQRVEQDRRAGQVALRGVEVEGKAPKAAGA